MYVIATQLTDGTLDYDGKARGIPRKSPLIAACRRLARSPAIDATAYCVVKLGRTWHEDVVVFQQEVKR